jgi:glycosyltransferase involved in cell wall biosynthesis
MVNQEPNQQANYARKQFLFVIHGLPMGGAEKFLITLLNHFVSIGHQPILILLSDDLTLVNELSEQIIIKVISKKRRFDITFPFRVKMEIMLANPDLIICINPYSFFIAKLPFLFNKKYCFCLSPHSTVPISFRNYIQNILYMLFIKKEDLVIFLCEKQKEFMINNYPLASKHLLVINNGIDFQYFNLNSVSDNDVDRWRQYCNINENDKVVLLAARITPEKRHIDAIDVIAQMNEINTNKHHLLIVGNGPDELVYSLKKHVTKLNQERFIHFLGLQQDVRPFYAMADLFVLTSFSETFSIAVIESFSLGVPVAITDVGGAGEMVVEGLNGVLTTPKDIDGMVKIWMYALNNEYNQEEIIQSARDRYDLPVMLRKYENAFFKYSATTQN